MASPTFAELQSQIKTAEARIEEAQTSNEELEATLNATELCIRTLNLTSIREHRKEINKKCYSLLKRAEQLKKSEREEATRLPCSRNQSASSISNTRLPLTGPCSSRSLTTREKIILLQGSKMHGTLFPPWKSTPETSEFELLNSQTKYIDTFKFYFSKLQEEALDGWQRPNEIFSKLERCLMPIDGNALTKETSPKKVDLVQDITTDCSVVASLCALVARIERGYPKFLSSIVYPYHDNSLGPPISPNGKFIFKLHFNGCDRKVIIDDRLPRSKTTRFLHVVDRNDASLLWPALVEKAYLKVRGGYDLPGSNSATDLWVLTGWLPEQLFLQSDDIDRASLWLRISKAFDDGDVLITVGTGRLTESEEESMGLVGEHDYAILDIEEFEGQRQVLVKNPWAKATVWKGSSARRKGSEAQTSNTMPGTFWMDLNDVFQSFESMYLSWNPALFMYREDTHFSWDLTVRCPAESFWSVPQYSIRSNAACVVWLLLSRHLSSSEARICNAQPNWSNATHGFICLYACRSAGQRVLKSGDAFLRGPYVDSPNTLLKLQLPATATYTIITSEQALPRSKINFTLSVLSTDRITFKQARESYEYHQMQRGAWTISSSGGNVDCSTYASNPSFKIQLDVVSDIALFLEGEDDCLSMHVNLVWARGRPVTSIMKRDVVGDSGEYTEGFALAELPKIQPGTYTIVCSTFDQGQNGKFCLRVGTTSPCKIEPIFSAAAGRLTLQLRPVILTPSNCRLLAPLSITRFTRVRFLARWNPETTAITRTIRTPIKIGLEQGRGFSRKVLVVSGDNSFSDNHLGLETPDVDLQPSMCDRGGLWIFIEKVKDNALRYGAEGISLELLSDAPTVAGPWAADNDW